MVKSIQENGKIIKDMVLVKIRIKMVQFMKDIGKMIKEMEKEH